MNAMSHRSTIRYEIVTEAHSDSDARAETARHYIGLRIHASIMLSGAILAGYCGIRILGLGDPLASSASGGVMTPPELPSICAMTVFFAIAAFCLLEAHRCWRKAVIAGARNRSEAGTAGPSTQLSRGASR